MSVIRSYHDSPPDGRIGLDRSDHGKVNLSHPLPDRYRAWSPAELEDERGRLVLLLDDATDERDRVYWHHQLEEVERRLERVGAAGCRVPNRAISDRLIGNAKDLKASIDLPRFVMDELPFTALRQTGDHWIGHCPVPGHDDKTPSFVVYDDGGWTCFGRCGISGDVFTLVGLCFGLDTFPEQVRHVAALVGQTSATAAPRSIRHKDSSFTTDFLKGLVNCERSGRGKTFQPIRIVNGRMVRS